MPRSAELFELIADAQSGDRAARDELFRRLYPQVAKHLSFILSPGHLRDEALQESMVEIYRSLPTFREKISVRAWALRISSRTAWRYVKREQKRLDTVTEEGQLPSIPGRRDPEAGRDELRQLRAYLSKLSPKKRESFILIEVLGLSAREAGQALGVSEHTAASRLRHARRELMAMYARDEGVVSAPFGQVTS